MENNTSNPLEGMVDNTQQSARDKVEYWLSRGTLTVEELEADKSEQAEASRREEELTKGR